MADPYANDTAALRTFLRSLGYDPDAVVAVKVERGDIYVTSHHFYRGQDTDD